MLQIFMGDQLTEDFRKKVNSIIPLNKRALASELKVGYDKMSKWISAGINIKDTEDRKKVGAWLKGEPIEENYKNNSNNISNISPNPYIDKYIASLEKRLEDKDAIIERLIKIEANLNAVLNSQSVIRATVVGYQEEILAHLAKNEQERKAYIISANNRMNSCLKTYQKEGILSDENKTNKS